MPTLSRASAWVLASSLAFSAGAVAQGQQAPQTEPKSAAPVSATPGVEGSTQAPRLPSAGRNPFFSPVMGIDIKGEGIALPPGVAQPDEPIKPPAPAAPPPATAK